MVNHLDVWSKVGDVVICLTLNWDNYKTFKCALIAIHLMIAQVYS
jgi:hypothetical protein